MPRTIKVNYKNLETKEFLTGTSLKKISESFSKYYNYPILIGKVDNNMTELNEPITRSCSIDFYDRSSGVGNSIYGRTAQFLLIVAIKKVLGNDTEVIIENSIDKGFYAKITNEKINKTIIKKIEELHAENELLKKRLYELIKTSENKKSVDVNYITDTLTVWESVIKLIEVRERREVVRTIVDKIIWDGESAHIYFFG